MKKTITKKAAPAKLLAVVELAASGAVCDGFSDTTGSSAGGSCWSCASGLGVGDGAEEDGTEAVGSGWMDIGEDYIISAVFISFSRFVFSGL